MECRNFKSDWMDGDNKLCYHPKDKRVLLRHRSDWCEIENISHAVLKTRKQIKPHKKVQQTTRVR